MTATPACCGVWSKHVTLINNVYPREPGEEGPRGSALSLVIFYATTKPYKLPKIGAYLEKRVKMDSRKSRFGYNRVTLQILHSLLIECRQNSNLISKNILRIILDVLHSPDPDLVMQATSTFILFSSHHNHQNIIDDEFTKIYSQLIQKFCKEAAFETSDATLQHKTRLSGLKALEAVCDSDSFIMSPHLIPYSQQIIPAALANMGSSHKHMHSLALHSSSPQMYTRKQSITDQLITDDELKYTANICICGLFRQANVANVKDFLISTCRYLDEKSMWVVNAYALDVIQSVTSVVQTQYHYIILSIMLERLESESDTVQKITVVQILTFLVTTGDGIAGITVPELLEIFARHLNASAETSKFSDGSCTPVQQQLQKALVNGIGSLVHHLIYPNQVNDIISFLVNRLLNMIDVTLPCILFIRSIEHVLAVYKKRVVATEHKRQSMVSASISFELVAPTLILMTHKNADVRLEFFALITKALSLMPPALHDVENHGPNSFHGLLWHKLYNAALCDFNNPSDYIIVGRLAVQLMQLMPIEDLFVSVPVFFRLQIQITENQILSVNHSRALANLIVEYFVYLARFLGNTSLLQYVNSIKDTRIEKSQWFNGFEFSSDAVNFFSTKTFENAQLSGMDGAEPIDNYLDRALLIGMLVRDSQLKNIETATECLGSNILIWERVDITYTTPSDDVPQVVKSDEHASTQQDSTEKRPSQLKTIMPTNVKRNHSGRAASEHPYSAVRIEDFKEALVNKKTMATNADHRILDTSNIDINAFSTDGTELSKNNVSSLLKNITATFGKSGQASAMPAHNDRLKPNSDSVELDWLTARSKEVSNYTQASPRMARVRSASQQRMRSSGSNSSLQATKIREPDMLGLGPTH
ncbi:plasma membrane localization protein [Batrachochytrium dendrobatidis]